MTAKILFAGLTASAILLASTALLAVELSSDSQIVENYSDNTRIVFDPATTRIAADDTQHPPSEPVAEPPMAPADSATEATEEDAREIWERWGFSGSARAAYWSSSRLVDDDKNLGAGSVWLKWTHQLPHGIGLYAQGWARSDNVFKGTDKKYLMREAYADYALGSWDFRFGRQIIAWGRADRINPTDNLTPRDFKILVPEDDDNRFGALAAKARYSFGDYSITGVWLPDFRPNHLPFPQQTGVSYDEAIPGSHRTWAAKFERSGKDFDWSVSYYDGFDLNPDISVKSAGPTGVNVLLSHHRYRAFGADAATTLGRYGLRGEIAYARTDDSDGNDLFVKNPFMWGVVGVERTFLSYLNLNVQYYFRYVTKWEDPTNVANPALKDIALTQAVISNQRDKTQHGVTFRVSNKWLNETLEGEIAGIWDVTRGGYLLRPKAIYAINDKWKAVAGYDHYGGSVDSFFGRLEKNRAAYVEMIYGF